MKKLYHKFFYIPKHGKIRETVMLVRVALTMAAMLICLIAMCLTAYAYFSHSISSGMNVLRAADFKVSLSFTSGENEPTAPVFVNGNDRYTLNAGTHTVTLNKGGTATTGFCIVKVKMGETEYTFHTKQLGENGGTVENQFQFTLDLESEATVTFIPHWGTSSYYGYETAAPKYINAENCTVTIPYPVIDSKEETPEQTEPTDTSEPDGSATDEQTSQVIHMVQSGDNLSKIARAYNTTVQKLAAYNNIADTDIIYLGQDILIPPSDWEIPAQTP